MPEAVEREPFGLFGIDGRCSIVFGHLLDLLQIQHREGGKTGIEQTVAGGFKLWRAVVDTFEQTNSLNGDFSIGRQLVTEGVYFILDCFAGVLVAEAVASHDAVGKQAVIMGQGGIECDITRRRNKTSGVVIEVG